MGYVFVADDFTGASDTLATLARGGLRARLFRDMPSAEDLAGIDAWGVATHARSLGRDDMAALADRIGRGLAAFGPDFVHVKICSTFDSSAGIGNVALLAQGLAGALGIADIAVLAGQPSLGRYAVFGTLFARGPDGRVHRIDRHPVMAVHPVTPMHEADLARHLAALGLHGLHLVGRGQAGGAFPRLYDLLDQGDVASAGADLAATARPLVVMGASSVAEAWLATQPTRLQSPMPSPAITGPIFAFAGSRSSLTTAQVGAAEGLARLPISPGAMMEGGANRRAARDWALERLARGQDCLIYLTSDDQRAITPADLAQKTAAFVGGLYASASLGGLIVAGGDTSSAIVGVLAPAWLDYAGELCPGVPILQAQVQGAPLLMALKGGQMGGADFFPRAVAALRGA
ncbi:four-carbon acid sugar kinase family protein [Frigidibacter albus]|uniref:Four-carbon acid sugar kinase family protein n=1 Tax=Frigidibacter albus TaxID=1465486 RepID=A0A6L8VB87_9RHOB|nr:four-carbon acid sugar kinase family protein [Frigidibacter albus]MZQ87597.1 four-carbon acid sugar kinase family protein [Frigidibacter albus]NBE29503.1 four-carbon acid sugar kinase family protein [Frigidibacter albus]GGH44468.1 hypothetical protein GCM10011341_03800 [Frigidibacter albus]